MTTSKAQWCSPNEGQEGDLSRHSTQVKSLQIRSHCVPSLRWLLEGNGRLQDPGWFREQPTGLAAAPSGTSAMIAYTHSVKTSAVTGRHQGPTDADPYPSSRWWPRHVLPGQRPQLRLPTRACVLVSIRPLEETTNLAEILDGAGRNIADSPLYPNKNSIPLAPQATASATIASSG